MHTRRSLTYHQRKVAKANTKRKAVGLPEIKKLSAELAQYGY